MNRLPVGTVVRTVMGCRRIGTIASGPLPLTEGSYKQPPVDRRRFPTVWIRWHDGSSGWEHRCHVERYNCARCWNLGFRYGCEQCGKK